MIMTNNLFHILQNNDRDIVIESNHLELLVLGGRHRPEVHRRVEL